MTRAPLTLLAFDFGVRRIGVAVGQMPGEIARALTTLHRGAQTDWAAIENLIREWRPQQLVVGLPYNMDGSPSPMTAQARDFGAELAQRAALPVDFADERLSSHAALAELTEQRQAGRRRRVRREDIDREAARLIAAQWMAAHPERPT